MYVTSLYAGSLGIRLKSNAVNLLGEADSAYALNKLIDLIIASKKSSLFREILERVSPRAIMWYRNLLEVFKENAIEVNVELGSTALKHRVAHLNYYEIQNALSVLSEAGDISVQRCLIIGTLVAVNLKRKTFAIDAEDDYYFGSLSQEILERCHKEQIKFRLPLEVKATLDARMEVNEATKRVYKIYACRHGGYSWN